MAARKSRTLQTLRIKNSGDLAPPGALPATEPSAVLPRIRSSLEAYHRDLPSLLQEHYHEWVAYSGDRRLGFSPSKTELYQACLRQGLHPGEFVVLSVEPEMPKELEALPDV